MKSESKPPATSGKPLKLSHYDKHTLDEIERRFERRDDDAVSDALGDIAKLIGMSRTDLVVRENVLALGLKAIDAARAKMVADDTAAKALKSVLDAVRDAAEFEPAPPPPPRCTCGHSRDSHLATTKGCMSCACTAFAEKKVVAAPAS